MKKSEIKSLLEEGYLRVRVIFQIVGKPKEHVEESIKAYIENIKTSEEMHVIEEDFEPTEQVDEGLFSAVCEAELLLKDLNKLTWLAINFSPASIEIIEPKEFTTDDKEMTHWINDMLAKLHEVGMVQKSLSGQNKALIKNFNAMTKNAINLVLSEPKELSEISKKIGLSDEYSVKFLDAMIKEQKVKKDKNKYHLLN